MGKDLLAKKVRVIRTTSRSRSTAQMLNKGAEAVRVRTWFSHLLERALGADVATYAYGVAGDALGFDRPRPDLVAALEAWLTNKVDTDLGKLSHEQVAAVTRLKRSRYVDGQQSPTDLTLSVFDAFLPNSREVYELGPGSLPLWAVIDNRRKICQAYVAELQMRGPEQSELTFEKRVQLIFDSLIAPEFRKPWFCTQDVGREQQSVHPVLLTHLKMQREGLYDERDLLEVRVIDDQIVGALALWQEAINLNDKSALYLEWLLMGLCCGVIAEQFSEPIQQCVLSLLKRRGKELDGLLYQAGTHEQNFEARWTAVINVKSLLKKQGVDVQI